MSELDTRLWTRPLEELEAESARLSQELRELDYLLSKAPRGGAAGRAIAAAIRERDAELRDARRAVRAHPDHSYDGL